MNAEEKFVVRKRENYGDTSFVSCIMPNEIIKNLMMPPIAQEGPETI